MFFATLFDYAIIIPNVISGTQMKKPGARPGFLFRP